MLLDSNKLKQVRKEKGWSQELLAKASGLSLRTIQRIETDGRASAESFLSISSALELSPNVLHSSLDKLSVNWTRKMIMNGAIGLSVISAAIGMLFLLGGKANIFIDWYGLGFLVAFVYAATIISFGVTGLIRSLSGFKYLFAHEIIGGKPASYLTKIYQSQILFCYSAAILAFFIGCVAIHGNVELQDTQSWHKGYAVNTLVLVYAVMFCETILRPLKIKFESCDHESF